MAGNIGDSTTGAKFFAWLFCICSSLMGVQFVYSIQFALSAPLFQHQLRMEKFALFSLQFCSQLSRSVIAIILATAGPISGFIVQPIVGVWSDGLTARMGRRRPFILVGAICCVVGMALIGGSVDLGYLLGDVRGGTTAHEHTAGIVLAISGLWIMNLFVNVIQGPARAVVVDLVRPDRQQDGNAMVSGVMGVSGVLANVVGAQLFFTSAPYRNLFFIGVGFVLASVIPTMLAAKEKRFDPSEHTLVGGVGSGASSEVARRTGVAGAFYKIYFAFRTIPRKMILVVLVYFFSWCAYSPYMIYITTWFGDNVYGGGSRADKGVQMGMYGLAAFALSQWLFSLVLAPLVRASSVRIVYVGTQLLASVCYIAFYWVTLFHGLTTQVVVAFVLMALIAANFSTMNSVPFALVRNITGTRDAGLYMGVLNAASVVAQTVTNLLSGLLLTLTATKTPYYSSEHSLSSLSSSSEASGSNENVAIALLFGGALSVFAMIAGFFLKEEQPAEETRPLVVNSSSPNV